MKEKTLSFCHQYEILIYVIVKVFIFSLILVSRDVLSFIELLISKQNLYCK